MKYCTNCGIENNDSDEICKECDGLIFSNDKPNINKKPSIIISILCFLLPLVGIIIASFCDDKKERQRYRNCALLGMLFYLIISLVNRCIVEQEYQGAMDKLMEEIHNRER
ncbi:MAG: hypothetical protein FWD47_08090 [Treponema sp.]|nr:hypothetical protein [Treponema sp.]